MSKYSDFDAEEFRGRVRFAVLVAVFVIIGLFEWLFGHPTQKERDLAVGLFLFVVVLEYLESNRHCITRLNELMKGRHKELRDDIERLSDNLRDLDKDVSEKLRALDTSVSDELRDLDKAVFSLSLKVRDSSAKPTRATAQTA